MAKVQYSRYEQGWLALEACPSRGHSDPHLMVFICKVGMVTVEMLEFLTYCLSSHISKFGISGEIYPKLLQEDKNNHLVVEK